MTSFKAYDIRGRVPDEVDADLGRKLGRALARFLEPHRIAVGHDVRLSSPELAAAVTRGLVESGVDVLDIGRAGTEQVYFATFHEGLDGGVMVTASHNPKDYNGFKLVRERARPISSDTGLKELERLVREDDLSPRGGAGQRSALDLTQQYVQHLLTYVAPKKLAALRVVTNAGNGGAGAVIDALEPHLPLTFVKLLHEPDGRFPHGVPNPLLPENRALTAEAVRREKADLGIAWDGDFDRCFFYDERGEFIEGYYIVGLLAAAALAQRPGGRIVHDPRLTWNTIEIVREAGGTPVQSKSGHAFIKEVMRREDAIYGGEMSAHHYFREFAYCDSGMIAWLLLVQLLSTTKQPLSSLVAARMERYPASGEINRTLADSGAALAALRQRYGPAALAVDETDGVSFELTDWRFNVRLSNTEPLVRLNVESRGDRALMQAKTQEVLQVLESAGGAVPPAEG
jgi:phosphomannomutase